MQADALQRRFGAAWRHGVRLGLHCSYCCAGLTANLLVVGVMDLRAMAVTGAAITLESPPMVRLPRASLAPLESRPGCI